MKPFSHFSNSASPESPLTDFTTNVSNASKINPHFSTSSPVAFNEPERSPSRLGFRQDKSGSVNEYREDQTVLDRLAFGLAIDAQALTAASASARPDTTPRSLYHHCSYSNPDLMFDDDYEFEPFPDSDFLEEEDFGEDEKIVFTKMDPESLDTHDILFTPSTKLGLYPYHGLSHSALSYRKLFWVRRLEDWASRRVVYQTSRVPGALLLDAVYRSELTLSPPLYTATPTNKSTSSLPTLNATATTEDRPYPVNTPPVSHSKAFRTACASTLERKKSTSLWANVKKRFVSSSKKDVKIKTSASMPETKPPIQATPTCEKFELVKTPPKSETACWDVVVRKNDHAVVKKPKCKFYFDDSSDEEDDDEDDSESSSDSEEDNACLAIDVRRSTNAPSYSFVTLEPNLDCRSGAKMMNFAPRRR